MACIFSTQAYNSYNLNLLCMCLYYVQIGPCYPLKNTTLLHFAFHKILIIVVRILQRQMIVFRLYICNLSEMIKWTCAYQIQLVLFELAIHGWIPQGRTTPTIATLYACMNSDFSIKEKLSSWLRWYHLSFSNVCFHAKERNNSSMKSRNPYNIKADKFFYCA